MRVEYHPSTTSDLNDAINHYNDKRTGLGDSFRVEVYAAIDRIIENPELFSEVKGVRRALVRRFPYSVVYRLITNECIRILIIRHHKRHPKLGTERE